VERPSPEEIDRIRTTFFRKTRWISVFLFATFALVAVVAAVAAVRIDARPAVVSMAVALLVTGALSVAGTRLRIGPRAARMLVVAGPVAGVLLLPLLMPADGAAFWGVIAGAMVGAGGTVAYARWRLAHDDDLILRQRELGFDPERPWGWLRR
jgi:FtsH-binding integral membrane protein